ncbi:MAG: bifunctional 2-polyprenyl-6-hydroxyphenol methylase/3-demethylubiquinol 3-O-methyltransferase UbiG [Hyphomicrobiaceae bacterium]
MIDESEVARFRAIAAEWWDEHGKFRPLHQLAPARMAFIRDGLARHFDRDPTRLRPLAGLSLLDVGCGGGLVAEPLARLGATVTGIDPGEETIAVARAHAAASGLLIDYRAETAEAVLASGRRFDAVTCLEVVEHVPDPEGFVRVLAGLVRPGGLLVLSTLNRTARAYLLAIVGAEYVLGWLPTGTHRYDRFITPAELEAMVEGAGLEAGETKGIAYDLLSGTWSLGDDTAVNYMTSAVRPDRDAPTPG